MAETIRQALAFELLWCQLETSRPTWRSPGKTPRMKKIEGMLSAIAPISRTTPASSPP